MISIGENRAALYKGDFHPAKLYKGGEKIAGYTLEEFSGEGTITLPDCYNDKVYDAITDSESITLRGKNILDMSGLIVRSGYYLDSSGESSNNTLNNTMLRVSAIKVKPSETYTISSNLNFYTIWLFDEGNITKVKCITAYNLRKKSFTTPENCHYIRVSFRTYEGTYMPTDLKCLMLEKGMGNGIYEPYITPCTVGAGEEIPTFHGTTVIEADGQISGKYKKRSE